jgi:hypothetical protein
VDDKRAASLVVHRQLAGKIAQEQAKAHVLSFLLQALFPQGSGCGGKGE